MRINNIERSKRIHLAAPWTVFTSIPLFIAYSYILYLFVNTDLEWNIIVIASFPVCILATLHLWLFLRGITTVVSITSSEIVLKKLGVVIERLQKEEVCCIGVCSQYHRSSHIFLSTVSADNYNNNFDAGTTRSGLIKNHYAQLIYKKANKRNCGIIVVEHTPKREKNIRDLIEIQWIDLRYSKA